MIKITKNVKDSISWSFKVQFSSKKNYLQRWFRNQVCNRMVNLMLQQLFFWTPSNQFSSENLRNITIFRQNIFGINLDLRRKCDRLSSIVLQQKKKDHLNIVQQQSCYINMLLSHFKLYDWRRTFDNIMW